MIAIKTLVSGGPSLIRMSSKDIFYVGLFLVGYLARYILLFLAGLGLLTLKRWGRQLSLIYAYIQISIYAGLAVIFGIVVDGFNGLSDMLQSPFGIVLSFSGVSFNWIFPVGLGYVIILVIVLNLPVLKKQFQITLRTISGRIE